MMTEIVGPGDPSAGAELRVGFREGIPVFRLLPGAAGR